MNEQEENKQKKNKCREAARRPPRPKFTIDNLTFKHLDANCVYISQYFKPTPL